jgi:hypothetical protein
MRPMVRLVHPTSGVAGFLSTGTDGRVRLFLGPTWTEKRFVAIMDDVHEARAAFEAANARDGHELAAIMQPYIKGYVLDPVRPRRLGVERLTLTGNKSFIHREADGGVGHVAAGGLYQPFENILKGDADMLRRRLSVANSEDEMVEVLKPLVSRTTRELRPLGRRLNVVAAPAGGNGGTSAFRHAASDRPLDEVLDVLERLLGDDDARQEAIDLLVRHGRNAPALAATPGMAM